MTIEYMPTDPDWPLNWGGCKVKGRFIDLLGEPMVGKVTFTPSVASVTNAAFKVTVVSQKITATLDANGAFELVIAASNDPDNNPTNWTYRVVEEFVGGRTYSIEAPLDTEIDLVDVAPVSGSQGNAIIVGPRGLPGAETFSFTMSGPLVPKVSPRYHLNGNYTLLSVTAGLGVTNNITLRLIKNGMNVIHTMNVTGQHYVNNELEESNITFEAGDSLRVEIYDFDGVPEDLVVTMRVRRDTP